MTHILEHLCRLALVGSLASVGLAGAAVAQNASDLDCGKCVDTSDIARQAVSNGRIKKNTIKFNRLNRALQQRIQDLEQERLDALADCAARREAVETRWDTRIRARAGQVDGQTTEPRSESREPSRGRDRELAALDRECETAVASLERRLDQLTTLERQLAAKHTASLVEQTPGAMETVDLAARAAPPESADPRRIPLKAGLGAILGGFLGLLVALFRYHS